MPHSTDLERALAVTSHNLLLDVIRAQQKADDANRELAQRIEALAHSVSDEIVEKEEER